jgi:hypothetical protein
MMLFAMLCVSGYLGAHRAGERAGAKVRYDESFFSKVYDLADVVIEQPDPEQRVSLYYEIIQLVQASVAPKSWGAADADVQICDIKTFPPSGLLASQYGAAHDQIAATLQSFRDRRMKAQTDKAAAEIERLAADEQTEPVVLSRFPQDEPLAWAALDLRYENAVRAITERWGSPRFNGPCIDAGFPLWSVAQSVATWPKNGGESYLAVQELPKVGRVLLTGWRPRQ